jgi:acetyl esterase/lipase
MSGRASYLIWVIAVLGMTRGVRADTSAPGGTESTVRGVRVIRDVVYRELAPGEDGRRGKNRLDLYLPKDEKDYPVLFFVHGGAWIHGDKDHFGLYSNFGIQWARSGVGVIVTNYRLSPGVKHPEHVRDVAKAFDWTHGHIAGYGGRPDRMFVCGHSAGGHLVSLLATDEQYLKEVGLGPEAIRGVISLSGVYRVHELNVLAGAPAGDSGPAASGFRVPRTPFSSVFGKDPEVRRQASPLTHVREGLPPFLIVYAERDLPTLPEMAREFEAALHARHDDVRTLAARKRNHLTVLIHATAEGDAVGAAMREFIKRHAGTR